MKNILILTKRSFTGSLSETEEVAGVETEKDVVEKPAGDDVAADASKENATQIAEETLGYFLLYHNLVQCVNRSCNSVFPCN